MSASNPVRNASAASGDTSEAASSAEVKSFPRSADAAETTALQPDTPANVDQAAPATAKPKGRSPRRFILAGIAALALAGGAWYGHQWWTVGRFMVSTDDAYVSGDITIISPKVSGYVAMVNVADNQPVRAGDPLITLDDGDYAIADKQARAQIATQELTIKRIDAQISGAQAALAQAEAQVRASEATEQNAKLARDRAATLNSDGHASAATFDTADAAWRQASAALAGATAGVEAAKANITVLQAQRAEAESALVSLRLAAQKAGRDLGFTVLRAPFDGVVGNMAAHDGDLVSAGERLAALVPVDALYVDANLKETQLAGVVPGEKVAVHVDAYEDEPIEGTVVSVSPASGSVFSLLPPNNATGNFTKVVQRVPVRIALPADVLATGRLRAGMSVVVDIDTRTAPAK